MAIEADTANSDLHAFILRRRRTCVKPRLRTQAILFDIYNIFHHCDNNYLKRPFEAAYRRGRGYVIQMTHLPWQAK
jgi:hypothetical protein